MSQGLPLSQQRVTRLCFVSLGFSHSKSALVKGEAGLPTKGWGGLVCTIVFVPCSNMEMQDKGFYYPEAMGYVALEHLSLVNANRR